METPIQRRAKWVKLRLQYAAGIVIGVLLVLKAFGLGAQSIGFEVSPLEFLTGIPTLKIVGGGLMYSAGFELAYMLFTPGPDEAIEPTILGLAAAVLLTVSGDVDWKGAVAAGALCAAIGFLFFIRREFPHDQSETPTVPHGGITAAKAGPPPSRTTEGKSRNRAS